MNRYSSVRDVTADQKPSGGGMGDLRQTWLQCPCKRTRQAGALVRGGLRLVCHVCAAANKAARAAQLEQST